MSEKESINYDNRLKKSFCNTRIWKLLLDESFEEFYSSFIDENWNLDIELFDKTIEYINSLLDENIMNIRYDSLDLYIQNYSNTVNDVLSDNEWITNSLLKLKEDLITFSSRIFKFGWNIENKEAVKTHIREFIRNEKEKINNIKSEYLDHKISETINQFTKKFFSLI